MTQEQYQILLKYEEQMLSAKIGNYVRKMYSQTLKELDTVYQQLFNQKSKLLSGCGKCILTDCKRLADEFFKYKDELEKQQINNNIEEVEIKTDNINTDTPKTIKTNNKKIKKTNK